MEHKPKIVILYHYYYPDDVVSARHFQDFCEELAGRGWDVEAWPSNRFCRFGRTRSLNGHEMKSGVLIRRIWRPAFEQASYLGRILNAAWMLMAWSWRITWTRKKAQPAIVLLGTDPPTTVFVTSIIRIFWPKTKVVLWCFDLVFEIAIANGMIKPGSLIHRITRRLYMFSYRKIHVIADLGSCMRGILDKYGPLNAIRRTLTPWALSEPTSYAPPNTEEQKDSSKKPSLVVLYSGNFGVAHSYDDILALARLLKNDPVLFLFGVRGNRARDLETAVATDDRNIIFLPFIKESGLEMRLAAAHIHLVSLRDEITGCVVPSKFFGSLAAGRPVLFSGSSQACISQWIGKYGLGWVLNHGNVFTIADELRRISSNLSLLDPYYKRCFEVYKSVFSKSAIMTDWDKTLRGVIN